VYSLYFLYFGPTQTLSLVTTSHCCWLGGFCMIFFLLRKCRLIDRLVWSTDSFRWRFGWSVVDLFWFIYLFIYIFYCCLSSCSVLDENTWRGYIIARGYPLSSYRSWRHIRLSPILCIGHCLTGLRISVELQIIYLSCFLVIYSHIHLSIKYKEIIPGYSLHIWLV